MVGKPHRPWSPMNYDMCKPGLIKLFINNQLIPRVDNGESFKYLGRYLDFGMANSMHKLKLTAELHKILSQIDILSLHPKYKILLYSRPLLSKISWHFIEANLSKTLVSESLDNMVASYIRRWLETPICGTLSDVFLTKTKFGLNLYPNSNKFVQCQTVARNVLKSSTNKYIQNLWKSTRISTNLQYDSYHVHFHFHNSSISCRLVCSLQLFAFISILKSLV